MSGYPSIEELVPHSGAMVVLESMTSWSSGSATCRATLGPESTYVSRGQLDAVVTIEHMAQAVAACLGYEAFQAGAGVRVGMVIASRRFEIEQRTVPVPAELSVSVKRIRGNDTLSHFDGTVRCGDRVISHANLTVYHAEKPPGA